MIKISISIRQADNILNFYMNAYERWVKRVKDGREFIDDGYFHRNKIRNDYNNVISIYGQDLSCHKPKKSQIKKWKDKGYYEFNYHKWYFAFDKIQVDENGLQYVIIKDIMYDADHHNTTMHNPMYERFKPIKTYIIEHMK